MPTEKIDAIVRAALSEHNGAIEKRLQQLVDCGVSITRISLERHPNLTTRIAIDDVPVAEFFLTVKAD